jgi:ribose transport system substrate-binding protein
MKSLSVALSLTNDDNDYQVQQAMVAREAARALNLDLQILNAANDPINQSQQLLKLIQSRPGSRPDAIIFEPAGTTAFPQAARAATAAGIAWVVLNWEAEYLAELRASSKVPVFAVSSDHAEIGRIQGRQAAALLPQGGTMLYIQGPSASTAAKQRTEGFLDIKPDNIEMRALRAQWTEDSSLHAVSSWLNLTTSRQTTIDLVAAHDDSMAIGARRAFEHVTGGRRQEWLSVPFIGCDGLPGTGKAWVEGGLLTATVVVPPNAKLALQLLTEALRGGTMPDANTYVEASSYPAIHELSARHQFPASR